MTLSYDGRGNVSNDVNTYTYDYDNRMITATGGINLKYDPASRLYEYGSGSRPSVPAARATRRTETRIIGPRPAQWRVSWQNSA